MALVKTDQRSLVSSAGENAEKSLIKSGPARTSSLEAPTLQLSGHKAEVLCVKYNPNGKTIASCGGDGRILFWETTGDCRNFCVLEGHRNAVVDLQWFPDSRKMITASADKSAILWDVEYGEPIKRFRQHKEMVNCCAVSPLSSETSCEIVASGGDEGVVRLWDIRSAKRVAGMLHTQTPVCSCAFSVDANRMFTAGLDDNILVWDLRTMRVKETLEIRDPMFRIPGHKHMITGIALSHDGMQLVSCSMDQTMRVFDVRPFVTGDRCIAIFSENTMEEHRISRKKVTAGVQRNLIRPAWSPDDAMVGVGSFLSPSDHMVFIFNVRSGQLRYQLPGHKGCVNEVSFHPTEPVIASASSDQTVFVGELALEE